MATPELTTERLVLDSPTVADAPAWSAAQDEECARWFDWPCPPGLERCTAHLAGLRDAPADEYTWAIRHDGRLVGGIDLKRVADGAWNVSYFVAPDARGRHVAREALGAVVAWGFKALGLSEISTEVHAGNAASRKVLEAVGFRVTRQRYDAENEHDVVEYLLRRGADHPRTSGTPALVALDRERWRSFMHVAGQPAQAGHCSEPVTILARAYAHRAHDAEAWGIAVDGAPAGLVMWWTWSDGPWLVIDQLLVGAAWQRRGLARWAIDQAGAEAQRRGCDALTCVVVEGNVESEALMAACGFERLPELDDGNELAYLKRL